jgi:hypothetical protein
LPEEEIFEEEIMAKILGIVDTENVPVAVLHYTAPAIVILWFLFSSSFQAASSVLESVNGPSSTGSSTPVARAPRQQPLAASKWLLVFAVLTFVCLPLEIRLI